MVAKESKDGFGPSLNKWAKALYSVDWYMSRSLFEGLEYKKNNINNLIESGLPMFRNVVTGVQDFIQDKEKVFSQLRYDAYFVSITNTNTGERNRELVKSKMGVDTFIDEHVDKSNLKNYQILLSESPKLIYNGVLVIDTPEQLLLEMVKGTLPDLVSKGKIPKFRASFDRENGFDLHIRYKGTKNTEIKEYMFEVIRLTNFVPGYYEFCLAKLDSKNDKLSPFFFECCRDRKTYMLNFENLQKDYSKKGLQNR
jgi:hypothetical protein